MEPKRRKDGSASKRLVRKKNRAGNDYTLSLDSVVSKLVVSGSLPKSVANNIEALLAIRDNAVHFYNPSPELERQVREIGTATLLNFCALQLRWFGQGISADSLLLMPIGFLQPGEAVKVLPTTQEANLVTYIGRLAQSSEDDDFAFAMRADVNLHRTSEEIAGRLAIGRPGDAGVVGSVVMSEEDMLKHYPLTYAKLTEKLRERYIDFKANRQYHQLRAELSTNPNLARSRAYNPLNPSSGKQTFFNGAIIKEFDAHYKKRSDG